jgi:hypothetical protein
MTVTITNTLSIPGNGLFDSDTRQVRFLKSSKSYTPDVDPRLPVHVKLSAAFSNSNVIMQLTSVSNVAVPSELSGTVGALRLKDEVMFYTQVFQGNSSLLISQRTVANTARATANGAISANTVVSLLGLRTV